MSKRKKIASVAFTGAAAAATAGLAAGPAHAASSHWVINKPNSTKFYGHNITTATLSAVSRGGRTQTLSCPTSTASTSGHVSGNSKTGVPKQLGTITKANFGTHASIGRCHLLTISFSAQLLVPSIGVNASKLTTPNNSTSGVTKGWVGKGSVTANPISAKVSGKNLACSLIVSGSKIPGSLNNAGGIFTVNPNKSKTLHIKHQSGCLGLFNSSAPAAFFAQYNTSDTSTSHSATSPLLVQNNAG